VGLGGAGRPRADNSCSSARQRRWVPSHPGGAISSPSALAKASAPAPVSMTWGERSITARAKLTGCCGTVTPATAPARRVRPSMTAASSSMRPSAVKTAPRPALNRGSSSSTRTEASTASSAAPPSRSTAAPACAAAAMAAR
jgi:hypothetical protein